MYSYLEFDVISGPRINVPHRILMPRDSFRVATISEGDNTDDLGVLETTHGTYTITRETYEWLMEELA